MGDTLVMESPELVGSSNAEIAEDDDAAEIVFPNGKSVIEGEARRPKTRDEKKNVAKGKYGAKHSFPPKKRKATASPEPPRTPLQSGISKLVEASVRYHPDKDHVLKRGFAGEGLTPPELRDMLRRLFRIRLTEPELSAVFAHFVPDGGMELDGNTFIIHYIQVLLCTYGLQTRHTQFDHVSVVWVTSPVPIHAEFKYLCRRRKVGTLTSSSHTCNKEGSDRDLFDDPGLC